MDDESRDRIRPVTKQGTPVPGMAVCDAGPERDGALRVAIRGDMIDVTALAARGTLPTTVRLPLSRLHALIAEAVRTASCGDPWHVAPVVAPCPTCRATYDRKGVNL